MAKKGKTAGKVRVQLDITTQTDALMDHLQRELSCRSRTDLLLEAFHLLVWITEEIKSGRRIISLDPDDMIECKRYKELISPLFTELKGPTYKYLIRRPHPWRKQMWVKGRNMTVGNLVYTMRTNNLTSQEAAEDLNLPLDAIDESLQYYALNKDLIEIEALEEKRRLQEKGYRLEPQHLS
jgi:uncharacterized protein (DUF433 family)